MCQQCGRRCALDLPPPPPGLCYCGNPHCILSILNREMHERRMSRVDFRVGSAWRREDQQQRNRQPDDLSPQRNFG